MDETPLKNNECSTPPDTAQQRKGGLKVKTSNQTTSQSLAFPCTGIQEVSQPWEPSLCGDFTWENTWVFPGRGAVTNGGSELSNFLNPTQPLTERTQLSQCPAWSLINGSIIYTMQFLTSYMKAPYILRHMALDLFTSER